MLRSLLFMDVANVVIGGRFQKIKEDGTARMSHFFK
jgi:hypothetical protein